MYPTTIRNLAYEICRIRDVLWRGRVIACTIHGGIPDTPTYLNILKGQILHIRPSLRGELGRMPRHQRKQSHDRPDNRVHIQVDMVAVTSLGVSIPLSVASMLQITTKDLPSDRLGKPLGPGPCGLPGEFGPHITRMEDTSI
jgi:hypothetical protein